LNFTDNYFSISRSGAENVFMDEHSVDIGNQDKIADQGWSVTH
jgi:hypothetical protein